MILTRRQRLGEYGYENQSFFMRLRPVSPIELKEVKYFKNYVLKLLDL